MFQNVCFLRIICNNKRLNYAYRIQLSLKHSVVVLKTIIHVLRRVWSRRRRVIPMFFDIV